jgi:hypothetical protein
MRVMTLGQLRGGLGADCTAALPTSDSVLCVIRGERGGWGKVLLSTLLRSALIAPGVYLAGGRGTRLALGSIAASSSITTFLFLWHLAHEQGARSTVIATSDVPQAIPAGTPATIESAAALDEPELVTNTEGPSMVAGTSGIGRARPHGYGYR